MNLRPGFEEIVSGWMLIDDVEALGERIEQAAEWTKINGPLLPDEDATMKFMVETQVAKGVRRGDFEPYIPSDAPWPLLTVAGRPDDPHTLKLACRLGATGEFPRGKHRDDDEGGLRAAMYVRDRTLFIEFGKPVAWLAMSKAEAIEFGNAVIAKANSF